MEIRTGLYYIFFFLLGVNFLIFGILVNFITAVLWVTIKPWNLSLYRKLTYYATFINWGQLVFIPEWFSSSTLMVYTDDETWSKLGKENALVVLNHSYEVDWVFVLLLHEVARVLGNAKAFVKKALRAAPVIGWTAYLGESVYLERNWEKDKHNIERQLKNLGKFPDPVWLTLFAEGTRYTPAKYESSVEFAKKAGLPPLQHLLLPRTKGFVLAVEQLRGKFPAIYSCTMVFDTKNGLPSFKNMVFGRPTSAEVFLERIPLDDVPSDPVKAADWLHDCYRQKDQLIDVYRKEGKFPSSWPESRYFNGPIRSHYRPRRLWLLLNTLCSCAVTLPPIARAFYWLLSSGIFNVSLLIVLLGLLFLGLQKMMELSSASKGSTYGDSPRTKAT